MASPFRNLCLLSMAYHPYFSYLVPEESAGCSIEAFLLKQGYTKSLLSALKKVHFFEEQKEHYGIEKNGQWAFTVDLLKGGDSLSVYLPPEEENSAPPYDFPLDIVYEDQDILLLDKPAGIPCHPSPGHFEKTLAGAVVSYQMQKSSASSFVCHFIHRLDLDTSGLILLAKHRLAASILNQDMKEGRIQRSYLAFCQGNPKLSLGKVPGLEQLQEKDKGVPSYSYALSAPIARVEEEKMLRTVDFQRGQDSLSYFNVLNYFSEKNYSLLQLQLATGRTHQIRVHLAYLSCPLLGDSLYGSSEENDFLHHTGLSRQALHSYSISFTHPIGKEKMFFKRELPPDLSMLLQ